jgi:hypothetical protein
MKTWRINQKHREEKMDTNGHADGQSSDKAGNGGLAPVEKSERPYDASLDPRTGRPPTPLEAQRLAREHEIDRDGSAQPPDQYQNDDSAHRKHGDVAEPDLEDSEPTEASALSEEQAPARMKSPDSNKDEKAAADALVQEGITREYAEQLVSAHGTDWETLKSAAWPEDSRVDAQRSDRKSVLREHHEEGIPPFETPGTKE